MTLTALFLFAALVLIPALLVGVILLIVYLSRRNGRDAGSPPSPPASRP